MTPMLTQRQAQVIALVSQGMTDREIARELFLGEQTVKMHIKGMLRAFGARNRTHAVAIAFREGLLE
jgi:DNA-binding NarL/FixJ family response regulator